MERAVILTKGSRLRLDLAMGSAGKAAMLGISPPTLSYRMNAFGIEKTR
jgi:hypothetical protein